MNLFHFFYKISLIEKIKFINFIILFGKINYLSLSNNTSLNYNVIK